MQLLLLHLGCNSFCSLTSFFACVSCLCNCSAIGNVLCISIFIFAFSLEVKAPVAMHAGT